MEANTITSRRMSVAYWVGFGPDFHHYIHGDVPAYETQVRCYHNYHTLSVLRLSCTSWPGIHLLFRLPRSRLDYLRIRPHHRKDLNGGKRNIANQRPSSLFPSPCFGPTLLPRPTLLHLSLTHRTTITSPRTRPSGNLT